MKNISVCVLLISYIEPTEVEETCRATQDCLPSAPERDHAETQAPIPSSVCISIIVIFCLSSTQKSSGLNCFEGEPALAREVTDQREEQRVNSGTALELTVLSS